MNKSKNQHKEPILQVARAVGVPNKDKKKDDGNSSGNSATYLMKLHESKKELGAQLTMTIRWCTCSVSARARFADSEDEIQIKLELQVFIAPIVFFVVARHQS